MTFKHYIKYKVVQLDSNAQKQLSNWEIMKPYSFVDGCEVRDVWRVGENGGISILQVRDEHTELSAPVTHMVHSHHIESNKLEYSTQTIAWYLKD